MALASYRSRFMRLLFAGSVLHCCIFIDIEPSNSQEQPSYSSTKLDFSLKPNPQLEDIARLQARFNRAATNIVSLPTILQLAIENNPSLLKSRFSIDQKFWSLTGQRRQWWPTLSFQNQSPVFSKYLSKIQTDQFSKSPSNNPPQNYNEASEYYSFAPSLLASWTFFSLPRQGAIKASFYALKSDQYLYAVALRDLILSVQQSYYKLQSSAKLIKSYTQIYETNKKQLEILEARFSREIIDLGTLEQARTQYYQQLITLLGFYNDYFQDAAQLSFAIGLPDFSDFIPTSALTQTGKWPLSLQESIKTAVAHREEILSSLALSNSDDWAAYSDNGKYFPTFSLAILGSYDSIIGLDDRPNYAPKSAYNYNQWTASSSLGINFTWSIFDGGTNAANALALRSKANVERSQAQLDRDQAAEQVKEAFYKLQVSERNITLGKQAVKSAKIAQDVSRTRFNLGLDDFTTVVQNVQLFGQVSQQYTDALLSYNTALAELYRYSALYPPDIAEYATSNYDEATSQ